ncbi:ribosome-inactivating family protein [Streptosporangium sp. CA-135522]|uniref:ribosome-inactivating family protein n=1 Tax=Streptosporangium sp. CA-135522 TaxID=3240072 RepID=UPI003D906FB5
MVLANDDILRGKRALGFDYDDASGKEGFRVLVEFLRARFATYQERPQVPNLNFMRVDIRLPGGKSIQLYFKKEDLYLVGWTINDAPAEYIGVGPNDTPRPQLVTRINTSQVIDIRYGELVKEVKLSREQMQSSLQQLYDHLHNRKGGDAQKPKNLQRDFDVIVRMTSEMARFGAYCDSFRRAWVSPWNQSKRRTVGTCEIGCFNDVVAKWDKFSRKANNGGDTLKWPGTAEDVTTKQAVAAIGDGVKLGDNISSSNTDPRGGQ